MNDMWSVSLAFKVSDPTLHETIDTGRASRLLRSLSGRGAVFSTDARDPGRLSVSFDVCSGSCEEALNRGKTVALDALSSAGIVGPGLIEARATSHGAELGERRLVAMPDLVGLQEMATILGVRKQRAHQLARTRKFPSPVARLAATPVWKKADVLLFSERRVNTPRVKKAEPPVTLE
jgi:hypothetical protein